MRLPAAGILKASPLVGSGRGGLEVAFSTVLGDAEIAIARPGYSTATVWVVGQFRYAD
ncbi:MAG: hypothetical protein HY236_16005 [Acidobacteria bacterium]|nr:hypothetical protein [Acidobacteriota bacterium]